MGEPMLTHVVFACSLLANPKSADDVVQFEPLFSNCCNHLVLVVQLFLCPGQFDQPVRRCDVHVNGCPDGVEYADGTTSATFKADYEFHRGTIFQQTEAIFRTGIAASFALLLSLRESKAFTIRLAVMASTSNPLIRVHWPVSTTIRILSMVGMVRGGFGVWRTASARSSRWLSLMILLP